MHAKKGKEDVISDDNNNITTDLSITKKKVFFEVNKVPNKGRGCLAEQNIKRGQLLHEEYAAIIISHDAKLKEWIARDIWGPPNIAVSIIKLAIIPVIIACLVIQFPILGIIPLMYAQPFISYGENLLSMRKMQESCSKLRQKFNNLNRKLQTEVLSLSNVFPSRSDDNQIIGIFCTNSFQLDEEKSGLFVHLSRFNHSCRPNCYFYSEQVDGQFRMVVKAIRNISLGEELTICYLDSLDETGGPLTRSERKQYLHWGYRFLCECEECSLPAHETAILDRKRRRLDDLRKSWKISTSREEDRSNLREQIDLLVDLEGCGKHEYILHALDLLFDLETEERAGKLSTLLEIANKGNSWANVLFNKSHNNVIVWGSRVKTLKKRKC